MSHQAFSNSPPTGANGFLHSIREGVSKIIGNMTVPIFFSPYPNIRPLIKSLHCLVESFLPQRLAPPTPEYRDLTSQLKHIYQFFQQR